MRKIAISFVFACLTAGYVSADGTDPLELFTVKLEETKEQSKDEGQAKEVEPTEIEAVKQLFDFPISRALGIELPAKTRGNTQILLHGNVLANRARASKL